MRDGSLSYYEGLWASMEILPDWIGIAEKWAKTILSGRARYQIVQDATGIPWPVIGAIAMRESGCDWSKGLHNGERWDRKTTLVPAGKGPFPSWEAAAIDALGKANVLGTIGAIGMYFEKFNGGGYMKRGVNSPYLWSGSQHGLGVGKYVADGKYSASAVDKQLGAMVALKVLANSGQWEPGKMGKIIDPIPADYSKPKWAYGQRGPAILALQQALAFSGCDPGPIDGICGARTADAYRQATGDYLSGDPADKRIPAVEYRRRVGQAAKVLSDQVAQLGAAIGDLREIV